MERQPFPIRLLLVVLFAVCPLLFFTDLTRNPYYTQIALLNVSVALLWLVWLARDWKAGALRWDSTALDLPFLVLISVSLLSWIVSMATHQALVKPIYSEGSRAIIFLLINSWLVYAAAVRARDKNFYRIILLIVYFVSVAASIYAIAQYFGQEWFWPRSLNPYGRRPVASFGNPNFLSSYLVLVIPVMVGDYLFKSTGLPRVILLAGILINTSALLATLTRSSWAGLAAGLVILFVMVAKQPALRKEASRWLMGLLIGMGLLVFFWPQSGGRDTYSATVLGRLGEVEQYKNAGYGPVWQRVLIWQSAWSMVNDHPWLGKGWGTFELFYPYYQGAQLLEPRFRYHRTHANNSHNEILEYWSQIGTVGLGIMIWLWVVFFRTSVSVNRRLEDKWRPIQAGLMSGVAGVLVDNLLNVSAHFAVPAFHLWWWVGMALALDPIEVETRTLVTRPLLRHLFGVVASVLLVVSIWRAFAFWQAEIYFFDGFKKSKGGVDLAGARRDLEKSYVRHPLEVNNNYELANIYARMGMRDQALHMYQRALDANPGYDEIFFNRGTVYMQMGRDADAILNYQTCLAINPLSQQTYSVLGALYFKEPQRWSDKLEALYQQGVTLFPNDRDLWNNLGWLYTERNQWPQAQNAYQNALKADPTFELARRNLAVVNEKLQQSQGRR